MPSLTFQDFINGRRIYRKFGFSTTAQSIFDYLSSPNTINCMIAANNTGLPALSGARAHIEATCGNRPDFDLNYGFARQCVGSMVSFVLRQHGFAPLKNKALKGQREYFKLAHRYVRTN